MGRGCLFLELLVHPHVGEVLDVGGDLGQGLLSSVLFLDLRIDTTLAGRLIKLPLGHLKYFR